LKATLEEIAKVSGFKVDSEISLNFTGKSDANGQLSNERSIDVAAFGTSEGKSYLLIFECKSGGDTKEPHKKASAWDADILKIRQGKARLISSQDNSLEEVELPKFKEIRVCYVFGRATDPHKFEQFSKVVRSRELYTWDTIALAYYLKTANTIGEATKYQILREFNITLESDGLYSEQAIQLTQGKLDMYVFGAKPSVLMKIGYVYRRASGKPSAYQRILSKERIETISQFLRSKSSLLPNAIIIAFDEDPAIQKEIEYKDGKLYFPRVYCSAWIIDGQHRVYGFLGTRYADEKDDPDHVFKLPVVAFKSMEHIAQNRTFVSINYNQKKIDPNLLCDLATELPDLNNELTWPSLLVQELNKMDPLKDKVRVSELHEGRPISITSFARFGLLEGLLGWNRKTRSYKGPLQFYSSFHPKASVKSPVNRAAMDKQVDVLRRYFAAVYQNTANPDEKKDPWRNFSKYSLLKPTGVNALLLVLSRLMEKYPRLEGDMDKELQKYLKPLRQVRFYHTHVAKQGGGWKGFRGLANLMLKRLNSTNGDSLRLFGQTEKV
jgi:DGQHR domain-containing protein